VRVRLLAALTSAIAIGFGLITLVGLLAGDDFVITAFGNTFSITTMTNGLLQLVVITVALTVLIGIFNLIAVHISRILRRRGGWVYSIVLVLSTLLVLGLTIAERASAVTTPAGQRSTSTILLESVQVATESALAGLVLFALVYGAYRLMRRRVTWWGMLFTLVLLIILIGALPLPGAVGLVSVRDWLMAVPVSAGARGILLGIALATVVTGVRVLIGQDRSYRE
jgi:hypothetical protein